MSAVKSGSSLRSLVLTPERIPSFLHVSRSPLLGSPWPQRCTVERTRLLSDHDDAPGESPPVTPSSNASSGRFPFCFPAQRLGRPRRVAAMAAEPAGEGPRAGVEKATTPSFLGAALTASRVQSLFHKSKPVAVGEASPGDSEEAAHPGRSRVNLRPVKAFGLHVMRELKRPAAALKGLSTSPRITAPR
ncbi:unnamed protein product [Menidia menidia]|uniref:(Atlantic silverside) hypothetical protein n=1 Tax=Menidia menidia TaxID=238744 RepID=A0A8S4AXU8_9TELE|nr:unnamed protein product [Menidia menidia]